MTNAELIRRMDDDGLAAVIMCPNESGFADIPCNHDDQCDCYGCCLKWLETERRPKGEEEPHVSGNEG